MNHAARLRDVVVDLIELTVGIQFAKAAMLLVIAVVLAIIFVGCAAAPAPTPGNPSEPVVTGTRYTPMGAFGFCDRHPEDIRCQPTTE